MGWTFDAGPLHFGPDGMAIKPQMKLAYSNNNLSLQVGVDDVRDGLSGAVSGHVHRVYTAEGATIKEVCPVQFPASCAWHVGAPLEHVKMSHKLAVPREGRAAF
jgi:hypothetical protein